jgi:hypothetical protein
MREKCFVPGRLRPVLVIYLFMLGFLCYGMLTGTQGQDLHQVYDDPTVTADFAARDLLPETPVPPSEWGTMKGWGPSAATYPVVQVPPGKEPLVWKRARIIKVAEKYIGLPYRHHHIPGWDASAGFNPDKPGRGLDCSNFSAWVYNYGLGIKFTSNILRQSSGKIAPGRLLGRDEAFAPGDLLFIMKLDRSRVSHVVIYIDEEHIIDCHDTGVAVRPFEGWYRTHFSHSRRIIE